MSKCRKCNIEILDETERCPLCNSVLEQTDELENMYPNVAIMTRKMMFISRVYLFCAILLEVVLVGINATGEFRIWWSVIAGLGFLYGYLVIRFAILGKSGYKSKVMVLALIAVLLAVVSDFVVGYQGWSINYAIPITILLVDAVIVVLMIINKRNWQSYMMWQILMILCSIISLEFSVAGIASAPVLGEIAFAESVFLFLGTVIIGGRRARTELKRRFHIR